MSFVPRGSVVAESAQTDCGWVKAGDVVWLRAPWRLAKLLLAVRAGGGFFAVVHMFATLPSGAWSATGGRADIVNLSDIATLCNFVVHDGRVYV